MHKNIFKRKSNNFPLLVLLFLFMSIPIGVFGLLNLENFDTRNRAAQLKEDYKCVISFPYVNPSTIPVDSTVQVQVLANIPNESAKNLSIIDKDGSSVFKKTYTESVSSIQEVFTFTKNSTGSYSLLGTLESDVKSYPCIMDNNKTIAVVEGNSAPIFTTLPAQSKPSNAIKVNDSYEYTLKVEDIDNDTINYSFSFTPNSTWLKRAIVDNGSNGKLTLKLTGKPDKPGSYLANIFVHDGYQNHLKAQSWVISVNQDKNDIPKITITNPKNQVDIKSGEKVTISWKVEDLNVITKQEVFLTNDIKNEDKWIKLETLTNKYGNYILDTSALESGKYYVIITATDNYSPAATGKGISPVISIENNDNNGPDDGVIISDPQVINISPSNEASIKNLRPNITATLIAGTKASIKSDSIKLYLDEKDITETVKINKISDFETTIIYTPTQDLTLGSHKVKVEFTDSNDDKAEKEWTFTVVQEDTNSDKINILGFEIDRKIFYIIIGGIALLLLALIIPWLLYLAWRGSNKDDDYDINTVYTQTPPPYIPMYDEPNNTYTEEKPYVEENNTYILPETKEVTTNQVDNTQKDKTEEYFENKIQQYPFTTDSTKTEETVEYNPISIQEQPQESTVATIEPIVEQQESPKNIDQYNTQSIAQPIIQEQPKEVIIPEPVQVPTPTNTTIEINNIVNKQDDNELPAIIDASEPEDKQYQELLEIAQDFEKNQIENSDENTNSDNNAQFNTPKPE